MGVLEHPTRYGQVVPYRWIALQDSETKQHRGIISLWDRQGERYV